MLRKPAAISASNLRRRIQDPALGWNRAAFVVLLCVIGGGHLFAEAPRTFTPPAAYNIQRYESGWKKNPFTLKTTPAVVTRPSFAADIAVAGISGDSANPTITLVNVKTHERFRLKTGGKAGNGMSVVRVRRATTHKETVVEVSLGTEINEVRYDDGYLRQVAGRAAAGAAPRQTVTANAQGVATDGSDGKPLLQPAVRFGSLPSVGSAETHAPTSASDGRGTDPAYVTAEAYLPSSGLKVSSGSVPANNIADTTAPAAAANRQRGILQVISRRVALRPAQFEPHPEPH
jgi:hypothetical protein